MSPCKALGLSRAVGWVSWGQIRDCASCKLGLNFIGCELSALLPPRPLTCWSVRYYVCSGETRIKPGPPWLSAQTPSKGTAGKCDLELASLLLAHSCVGAYDRRRGGHVVRFEALSPRGAPSFHFPLSLSLPFILAFFNYHSFLALKGRRNFTQRLLRRRAFPRIHHAHRKEGTRARYKIPTGGKKLPLAIIIPLL